MIQDVLTEMWKEWRDMPFRRGGLRGGIGQLVFVVILGVFLPWQNGELFLTSGLVMGFMVWAPFVLSMGLSADAFAGERERRTLETLLASRLSDRAILFGKMATIVCYAWGMSLLVMLLGLITVNVGAGHGKLLMYPTAIAIGAPAVALLAATFLTGLGVLASLRASTVRQATQTMSLLFLAVFLIPMLARVLPRAWVGRLFEWMGKVGMAGIVEAVLAILVVLVVVVVSIAVAKFKRSKLILD